MWGTDHEKSVLYEVDKKSSLFLWASNSKVKSRVLPMFGKEHLPRNTFCMNTNQIMFYMEDWFAKIFLVEEWIVFFDFDRCLSIYFCRIMAGSNRCSYWFASIYKQKKCQLFASVIFVFGLYCDFANSILTITQIIGCFCR